MTDLSPLVVTNGFADFDTHLHTVPCAQMSQPPKQHLNQFSPFSRDHPHDQQTHGHTDTPTDPQHYSVYSNSPQSHILCNVCDTA